MDKIKISLMRSFGSEQFSMTTEVSAKEVEAVQKVMREAITRQYQSATDCAVIENEITTKASEARTASLKTKEDALKAEMAQAKSVGNTIKQAQK